MQSRSQRYCAHTRCNPENSCGRLIKRRRAFFIGRVNFAFVRKEVPEPIVLATVFINGILHTFRYRNLVIRLDDFFGTFDDPRQNATASIVIKILAIVLDIIASCNLGVERDNNKSSPNTIIGCRNTGR